MADNETQATFPAAGRILLAAYLFLSTALFAYLTVKLWPPVAAAAAQTPGANQQNPPVAPAPPAGQQNDVKKEPEQPRPVTLFRWQFLTFYISADTRLILLVLAVGALGGCLHGATSFVAFAGRNDLQGSWVWWYLLRAPMSAALALIAYFAVRGGFLSSGAQVNDYGIVAFAGLVGMFTKQATAKLDEVFSTMFRTAPPPAGGQAANKIPALSAVDPPAIPHGGADTTITVSGNSFVDKSEVRWAGDALATKFVNVGQLTATVPAARLAAAGSFEVTVFSPAPGGGSSTAVKVAVS